MIYIYSLVCFFIVITNMGFLQSLTKSQHDLGGQLITLYFGKNAKKGIFQLVLISYASVYLLDHFMI